VGCCSHVCALLWHLGVNRGIINNTHNPLSASQLITVGNDSITFSDYDSNSDDDDDNNIRYSLNNDSADSSDGEQSDSGTEEE